MPSITELAAQLNPIHFVFPFNAPSGEPLKVAVVRWSASPSPDPKGNIVLFLHGAGSNKESWIPVVHRLLKYQDINVSEVWALDGANHGDSLVLNTQYCRNPEFAKLTVYGESIAALLRSGLIQYQRRHLTVIAHSGSVYPAMYAGQAFTDIPYKCLIILEPTLLPTALAEKYLARFNRIAKAKKWQWGSRVEAEEWFRTRAPWKSWHPEMLDAYLEYGLVHTPEGSQLKVPPEIEASCYPNLPDTSIGRELLPRFIAQVHTHFLFGDKVDFLPKSEQTALVEEIKPNAKSIAFIPNAGHMVMNQNLEGATERFREIIREEVSASTSKTRGTNAKL